MCAVLDANILGELFSPEPKPIPDRFFQWMKSGGRLVVGGRQWRELTQNGRARDWLLSAISKGQVLKLNSATVESGAKELSARPELRSDDPHVLAVALIGEARLLYSNDEDLQDDFKDPALIPSPAGRVYTSLPVRQKRGRKSAERPRQLSEAHKSLLRRTDLCSGCD